MGVICGNFLIYFYRAAEMLKNTHYSHVLFMPFYIRACLGRAEVNIKCSAMQRVLLVCSSDNQLNGTSVIGTLDVHVSAYIFYQCVVLKLLSGYIQTKWEREKRMRVISDAIKFAVKYLQGCDPKWSAGSGKELFRSLHLLLQMLCGSDISESRKISALHHGIATKRPFIKHIISVGITISFQMSGN